MNKNKSISKKKQKEELALKKSRRKGEVTLYSKKSVKPKKRPATTVLSNTDAAMTSTRKTRYGKFWS